MARTVEQLDGMVIHVRYEVVELINFVRMSNHWPHPLLAIVGRSGVCYFVT